MSLTTTGERYRLSFVPFPGIFQVSDQETGEAATAYRTLPEARRHAALLNGHQVAAEVRVVSIEDRLAEARAQLAAMRAEAERPALELPQMTNESPQLMPSIDYLATLDMFEEFGRPQTDRARPLPT